MAAVAAGAYSAGGIGGTGASTSTTIFGSAPAAGSASG